MHFPGVTLMHPSSGILILGLGYGDLDEWVTVTVLVNCMPVTQSLPTWKQPLADALQSSPPNTRRGALPFLPLQLPQACLISPVPTRGWEAPQGSSFPLLVCSRDSLSASSCWAVQSHCYGGTHWVREEILPCGWPKSGRIMPPGMGCNHQRKKRDPPTWHRGITETTLERSLR